MRKPILDAAAGSPDQADGPADDLLRLKALALGAAANGIVITDQAGRIIWCNQAVSRLTGYGLDELLGQTPSRLKSGSHDAKFYKELWQTILGGKVWHGEIVNRRKDGTNYCEEMTITPVVDSTGEVRNFVAIKQDISERNRMEETLRKSENRYRELVNCLGEGVVYTDAGLRFTFANPAAEHLLGVQPGQLIGRALNEFLDEPNKLVIQQQVKLRQAGETSSYELEIIPARGERRQILVTGTPRMNPEGGLGGTFAIFRDITRRKQAERQIHESEARYHSLFENMVEGFARCRVIFDRGQPRDFVYLEVNTAFEKLTGLKNVVGKKVSDVIPGVLESNPELLETYGRVALTGIPERFETCVAALGLWFSTAVYSHEKNHFVAIFDNITRRKHLEEEQQQKTALLEALVSSIPDGILVVSGQKQRIVQNEQFNRLLNIPRDISEQPDDEIQLNHVTRSTRNPDQFLDQVRRLESHPDETSRDEIELLDNRVLERNSAPVFGQDRKYYGRIWTFRDITGRKQAELKLRDAHAIQNLILENSTLGIALITNGEFVWANRRLAEMLDLPPEKIQGISTRVIYPSDEAFEWFGRLAYPVLAKGGRADLSFQLRRNNGNLFWCRFVGKALDPADPQAGSIWMIEDISDRKEAEQYRQAMEVQLRHAQKLEAIGQLAAGIAHEINTPTQYVGDNTRFLKDSFGSITSVLVAQADLLAAAKNHTLTPELIARTEAVIAAGDLPYLFEQIPAAIKETLEGVERVSKIVRAMKEFSHPSGKERAAADLNKAIESTVTVARNEWKYVADLKLDLEPLLPLVPCFLGEFNQCILNLVVNAAHAIGDVGRANPGSKGLITVSSRREDDSVEIRVNDTGTGIPEAVRPHIFEPFFTTKAIGNGTGQGLSIVYASIVKKHGGSVRFETETGRGTSFILKLPLMAPADSGTVHLPAPAPASGTIKP